MTISQRIFVIMKEKHLSQASLSAATGISPAAISDWKTKGTNPSADKLSGIANFLGVPVCTLLEGSDSVCVKSNNIETCIEVQHNNIFNSSEIMEAYLNLTTKDKLEIQLEILKRSKTHEK